LRQRDLRPLEPRYVSTVDSGNLAGHLIVLGNACREMMERPLDSGDVLSNGNTIILMGKTREGSKMGRALHVAKHRGSACDDSIVPFEVTESGLQFKR